eukprot:c50466_g1_i1 orf=15-164(-)
MIHKISKGVYFHMAIIENENKIYINDFEDLHLDVTNWNLIDPSTIIQGD